MGFRSGIGEGAGFCLGCAFMAVAGPLFLMYGCTHVARSALEQAHDASTAAVQRNDIERQRREAAELKKIEEARQQKYVQAGSIPPTPAANLAEARKLARIEGRDLPGGSEAGDMLRDIRAEAEAQKPLVEAVKVARVGHDAGEIMELAALASVHKGDAIRDVMVRFDAPKHRGKTNEVSGFSTAWPDRYFYSYDDAEVTFIVDESGKVETIAAGINYAKARRM
jgi:hypothetical protein